MSRYIIADPSALQSKVDEIVGAPGIMRGTNYIIQAAAAARSAAEVFHSMCDPFDPCNAECASTSPTRPDPNRPEETPMRNTVRTPIADLSDLKPGDTVVRKVNDESYTVEHVGRRHVLMAHPTSGVERSVHSDALGRSYVVLRPEPLPRGLERIGVSLLDSAARLRRSEYRYTDWAGDTARVIVSREDHGPVVAVSGNPTSVHFAPDALRHLLAEAEALLS